MSTLMPEASGWGFAQAPGWGFARAPGWGHLDEILTGHLDGAFIWMRHLSGWGFAWASIWMEFFPGIYVSGYGVLPRHMDGGIWMGFCNHGILPSGGTSFDKFCPHMSIFSIVA